MPRTIKISDTHVIKFADSKTKCLTPGYKKALFEIIRNSSQHGISGSIFMKKGGTFCDLEVFRSVLTTLYWQRDRHNAKCDEYIEVIRDFIHNENTVTMLNALNESEI